MSEPAYYDRQNVVHIDGTPIFQTREDQANEADVAALVSGHWDCRVRSFGALAPVDWYAERHGRLIGVLELKSRHHRREKYPGVFLNVRKWLALTMASMGLRVPAVFVVRFDDGVWWVPLTEVDASQHRIAGCSRIVKSVNDIEPVIYVHNEKFRELKSR